MAAFERANHPVPAPVNFWKPRWYVPQIEVSQRRLGGRIALVTETWIYDRRLVTYNLHLESKGQDVLRVEQLREALEDAGRFTESSLVILGGLQPGRWQSRCCGDASQRRIP
jgi:hypothetical protein